VDVRVGEVGQRRRGVGERAEPGEPALPVAGCGQRRGAADEQVGEVVAVQVEYPHLRIGVADGGHGRSESGPRGEAGAAWRGQRPHRGAGVGDDREFGPAVTVEVAEQQARRA
jgi:hypothetical protein